MKIQGKLFKSETVKSASGNIEEKIIITMPYVLETRQALEVFQFGYCKVSLKQLYKPEEKMYQAGVLEFEGDFKVESKSKSKERFIRIEFRGSYDKKKALDLEKMFDDDIVIEIELLQTGLDLEEEEEEIYEDA